MASTRPLTRDYKRTRQNQVDLARWKEFGIGLGIGLAIAVLVFAWQRNTMQQLLREQAAVPRPEPRAAGKDGDATAEAPAEEAAAQYDFYEMLPKFEVVVPEQTGADRSGAAARDRPVATITRPGTYVLQAGTFTRAEDAQRLRQQLALLGVNAAVQRVAVDADVRHRVRIGPITSLEEVNATRAKLQAADIESISIRVGD